MTTSNRHIEPPAASGAGEPLPARRQALLSGLGLSVLAAGAGLLPTSAAAAAGPLALPKASAAVTPFKVDVSVAALADLRRRLQNTRWPEQETVADWSQGVPLKSLRPLIDYWGQGYDWRRFERKLNAFAQFRTEIDGLGIHFIHVRSRHENALPLILSHGWPGSIVEFLDVIRPLTDPTAFGGKAEDAFHVVIPSLPGFGFDSPVGQAAWIYEKFHAWTDSNGEPERLLGRDAILDNISLYWLTRTAASSARIYAENKGGSFSGGKLDIPVAATVFPKEIYRAPKTWALSTYSKLIYWNEVDRGGHFAAFEQPELFVKELRAGFRALRT